MQTILRPSSVLWQHNKHSRDLRKFASRKFLQIEVSRKLNATATFDILVSKIFFAVARKWSTVSFFHYFVRYVFVKLGTILSLNSFEIIFFGSSDIKKVTDAPIPELPGTGMCARSLTSRQMFLEFLKCILVFTGNAFYFVN